MKTTTAARAAFLAKFADAEERRAFMVRIAREHHERNRQRVEALEAAAEELARLKAAGDG